MNAFLFVIGLVVLLLSVILGGLFYPLSVMTGLFGVVMMIMQVIGNRER